MTQGTETNAAEAAQQVRELLAGRHVCPFCGGQRARADIPCPRCTMEDTPATRQATIARLGPWFVLQSRNPSAPGMRWATLIALIRRNQVGPRSVVRGPATNQLWTFAAKVRGLSREMGVCYDCGGPVGKLATHCPSCGKSQEPPMNPDALLEALEETARRPAVMREIAADPAASTSAPPDPETQLQLVAPSGAPVRRDPRPRSAMTDPNSDDAILTARELATAFQLAVGPQAVQRHRRRTFKWVTLVLLLAGAVAAAIWVYNDADKRSLARGYLDRVAAWFKEKSRPVPTGLEDDTPLPPTAGSAPATVEPPAAVDRRPTPPIVERTPEPEPTPRPSPVPTPPTPEPPTGGSAVIAAIDPALANLTPIEQSRVLYRRAIDAMAREDWPTALRLLDAIESLPRNVHPGDLPSRRALVRQKLGGGQ